MRYKNIIKCFLLAGTFTISTSSCSDWLQVDMEDSILENKLFSTNEGFLTALNGIYSSMNSTSGYGGALSMQFVDIMAQYYNISSGTDHDYSYVSTFNFTSNTFDEKSYGIWSNMYTWIANVNLLLENCDAPDAAILPRYYPIVKGEALALRAMLHFDLLRLYGPIYSAETASVECLPYQETSKKDVQPLLTAEAFIGNVIRDLDEAAQLLKDVDPVITEGVKDGVVSDDGLESYDMSYRQLRLNYYAVEALLARAYLWKGDKTKTYDIVKNEIISKSETEALTVFPWMSKSDIQATINKEQADMLFSKEVLFGLYNMKRKSLYDSYFSPSVNANSRLYFVGTSAAGADSKLKTFYDDDNDIRKSMWSFEQGDTSGDNSIIFTKYKDFSVKEDAADTLTYRYMIPLIRKSELYLMAAECTDDIVEAGNYINTIRLNRGAASIEVTAENKQDLITKEFAREMIGEGQLFFYYKRLAMEKLASGTSASGTYSMTLSNYVLPLPTKESDLRK